MWLLLPTGPQSLYSDALGVGHIRVLENLYATVFFAVRRARPWRLMRLSRPFCFQAAARYSPSAEGCEGIQFASGLAWFDGQLAVGYGVNDCEALIAWFDRAAVEHALRKADEPWADVYAWFGVESSPRSN